MLPAHLKSQPVYAIPPETVADLEDKRFTYHPPQPGQGERYAALRQCGLDLALDICRVCPDSRERSLALTKLEEAIFWANAAIARNE